MDQNTTITALSGSEDRKVDGLDDGIEPELILESAYSRGLSFSAPSEFGIILTGYTRNELFLKRWFCEQDSDNANDRTLSFTAWWCRLCNGHMDDNVQ